MEFIEFLVMLSLILKVNKTSSTFMKYFQCMCITFPCKSWENVRGMVQMQSEKFEYAKICNAL